MQLCLKKFLGQQHVEYLQIVFVSRRRPRSSEPLNLSLDEDEGNESSGSEERVGYTEREFYIRKSSAKYLSRGGVKVSWESKVLAGISWRLLKVKRKWRCEEN